MEFTGEADIKTGRVRNLKADAKTFADEQLLTYLSRFFMDSMNRRNVRLSLIVENNCITIQYGSASNDDGDEEEQEEED